LKITILRWNVEPKLFLYRRLSVVNSLVSRVSMELLSLPVYLGFISYEELDKSFIVRCSSFIVCLIRNHNGPLYYIPSSGANLSL
jgi:hypothetical protein